MQKSEKVQNIDSELFDFNNIEYNSVSEAGLTIDLGHLIMKNQINQTFGDLLNTQTHKEGNLYILSCLRLMINEGGILNLINQYKGEIDKSYLKRMEILLNKAGFVDIEIINTSSPMRIKAVRRPVETEKLGYGLVLKEIIEPDEISRCHQFARKFYFYKDFNYDMEVVEPFDLNCDHFAVFDEYNKIYCMARIIIRTPGHYCPFMYATIPDGQNVQLWYRTGSGTPSYV